MPLPNFDYYTIDSCRLDCLTHYIVDKCQCRELYMQNITGVPVCSPPQAEDCSNIYKMEYVHLRPPCPHMLTCPVSCNEVIYSTTSSYAIFTDTFLQHLTAKYGQTVDYWKINAVGIRVYYSQLIEQVVTHQAAYSLLTMLCDVGGALGLILGASIISVIELFDFILILLMKG